SSISDPSSNDILEYPAISTKKISSNVCLDDKINYSVSSNSSISDPTSNDILEYPASSTKKNSSNNNSNDKINYSVSNSLTFDPSSNDILKYPATSTKRISPNKSSDYKINYSSSSNSLISDARSDDIFQFPPSKKIKLNDKLDYPQSSIARIIGSNFQDDNTNRFQSPINLPSSSTKVDVILHVLPVHHVHGLINGLLIPLFISATAWEHLVQPGSEKHVTVFAAVPTIYSKLTL
ncbi:unnamed protein product, partial [Rotaria sp. Silwood1]